jgi:hypothetical protein
MINAVLVFNNAGQPRLTKFYTQLVLVLPCLIPTRIMTFPRTLVYSSD